MTPFKVLYGRDPPRLLGYDRGAALTFEVDRYLNDRDLVLGELREHLLRAQQIMKAQADGKRRDVTFQMGDKVYLKLRPYRQSSVFQRANQKLAPRFYGPFEVTDRIGQVAYRLKLPPTSAIHPVFHVSQLKRAIGEQQVESALPRNLIDSSAVAPAAVLAVRDMGAGKEVLIAWKGMPHSESTWEPYDQMVQQFPDLHLEDKVAFEGRGDDANENRKRWEKVYHRRKKGQEQGGLGVII